jgi:hypothetical protein
MLITECEVSRIYSPFNKGARGCFAVRCDAHKIMTKIIMIIISGGSPSALTMNL